MSSIMLSGIPLFPLRSHFLFPGALAPLHIFEPRYRQMIGDLLDTAGRLVMGTLVKEGSPGAVGSPPVLAIGGLGEIIHHVRLADGRYLVWLLGRGRVRIEELSSERLYRRVNARLLPDGVPDSGAAEATELAAALAAALHTRTDGGLEVPDDTPVGLLADLLVQALGLPPGRLGEVFLEIDPLRRARRVLSWHLAMEADA